MIIIKEQNGLRLVLVSGYGSSGYRILDAAGNCLLGYIYRGTESSALRIFNRKALASLDKVTVCPYCMNEAGDKIACCGESMAHFEEAYVQENGELILASEVK